MIMHTITINQIPFSERGTCDVFINSTRVDRVDNNFDAKYTQLHIALAKCFATIGTTEVPIEYNVAEGCPTPYSLADVLEMMVYLPKVSAYRI